MNFDVLMPSILFVVTLASMILSRKAEAKLKSSVEEREFKPRDTVLLIIVMAITISVVVFIPEMALLALFMFSYCSLLFMISYAFSDSRTTRIVFYCGSLFSASILAAVASYLGVVQTELRVWGALAFLLFAAYSLFVLMLIRNSKTSKHRWYVGALSPALFLLLFAFYGRTSIGFLISASVSLTSFPYLLDVFGILFAMLIVLYLTNLFSWKTVFVFAAFITGMDIVLVWITGTMVQAAEHIAGLGLPVLVAFPTIPIISSSSGIILLRLGLGDFFFAGILGSQTLKKFGIRTAVISLITICISFGLFELLLLNPQLTKFLPVSALPATLPILIGWLPVIVIKILAESRKKAAKPSVLSNIP